MTTSDDVLAEIIEKAWKATPLPWKSCCDVHDRVPCECRYWLQSPPDDRWKERTPEQFEADETYKTLAANHAPALAAECKALREKLGRVEKRLQDAIVIAEQFNEPEIEIGIDVARELLRAITQ